mmetsp:Transcript_11067/g.19198  ORF Transcript_11067/g.19198 Transcript_11067/m.19198 type:complete len:345 (+) Transcript_11067:182-1216(+)|eukprot:CAMPEP_0119102690 /NCGR_PEP_ID=MMETSP1180-20130426/1348_1 /TAXON_ID=3052 ORGANISM="Chlamydomonas cf sp, Strain CCMP681" /NCGR_SAMPLE_ID=MMETSP1180 /ASSEMBLY_ACC=CAM_ASM_000741 /LENGTH=344 /DNA_ID=CAMNT_0007087017 /DNA_START=119 /DNA_END=1153 /DNA_ORIENTATION=-
MADGVDQGFSLHVGGLDYAVSDAELEQTFRTYYPSCRSAKVMTEAVTNRSRGFGFVRFAIESERDRALTEMNGVYVGAKPINCSLATARKANPPASTFGVAGGGQTAGPSDGETDPANTTLFIGGLSATVTEPELHAAFARCGEIVYTKIPQGKGCGFVQFATRTHAAYALEHMNGSTLGGMSIRISWGKTSKPTPSGGMSGGGGGPRHGGGPPPPVYAGGQFPGYGAYADPYAGYSAAAGYYPDPYAGATYAMSYGMPHDPYAAAAYGQYGMAAPTAGGVQHMAGTAAQAAAGGGTVQSVVYDPLAPLDMNKMNMAYMHRHIPVFTGAYVRVPISTLPMGGHM